MAQGKAGLCSKHSGGRRCEVAGFGSMALGKAGLCGKNGGDRRCEVAGCNKQASGGGSKPQVTDEVKQHAVDEAVGKPTGDAARRGLRPTDHVTSVSDEVKARSIQKEIDLLEEEKKQRRSVRACCDELCKKVQVRGVHITEEWVVHLKQRLPWI